MSDQAFQFPVELNKRTHPRFAPLQALLLQIRPLKFLAKTATTRRTQILLDAGLSGGAMLLAVALRFDLAIPRDYLGAVRFWIFGVAFLQPACVFLLTGYRNAWRFFTMADAVRLLYGNVVCFAALLTLDLSSVPSAQIPVSIIVIDFLAFSAISAGARGFSRLAFERCAGTAAAKKRVLVLGSELTLSPAVTQLRTVPGLEIVGLLARANYLEGREIDGVPVLGHPTAIRSVLRSAVVDVVVIADATLDCIAETTALASQFGCEVRLLPSAANVLRNEVHVAASIDADRILGRPHSTPATCPEIYEAYRDKVVLVTGGAGSIRSELCRQLLQLDIVRLVILDHSENSIFEIERELNSNAVGIDLHFVVGDVRDRLLLENCFSQYRPDIVLHSAAYKHVPMMEANPSEAFLNNVVGTRNVLEVAEKFEAERFILSSSDKAVAPSSVMGATKRLAEMLVQSRGGHSQLRLGCVRFGNVLGSRGSVVPIFLDQIKQRKPLTLTDERMSRYFMTAKEAVQLVLQSSTLACAGEIYLLNMGEPIGIAALSRRLAEMSGLRPDKDLPIEVVGSRPGEKLHEQLWCDKSTVRDTKFPHIRVVDAGSLPMDLQEDIAELEELAERRLTRELREKVQRMQIGYVPAKDNANSVSASCE